MQYIWVLPALFLVVIAQAMLRLAWSHGRLREWEPFLGYSVLGLMVSGGAVALGARAMDF